MGFASVFRYCYTGVIECNAMWQAGSRTKLVSVYLLTREYSMSAWSLVRSSLHKKMSFDTGLIIFPHKSKCVTGHCHTHSIVLTPVRTTQLEHCQAGQPGREGCTLGQQKLTSLLTQFIFWQECQIACLKGKWDVRKLTLNMMKRNY